jgi:hypothetical protein
MANQNTAFPDPSKVLNKIEAKRGSGECVRCRHTFPEVEIVLEFGIIHPITGQSKLSLLCRSCRRYLVKNMRWARLGILPAEEEPNQP